MAGSVALSVTKSRMDTTTKEDSSVAMEICYRGGQIRRWKILRMAVNVLLMNMEVLRIILRDSRCAWYCEIRVGEGKT